MFISTIMCGTIVLASYCLSFASDASNQSQFLQLASPELRNYCDSVTKKMASIEHHDTYPDLGQLRIKMAQPVHVAGVFYNAVAVGCNVMTELYLVRPNATGYEITHGPLRFDAGQVIVMDTVDLNGDGRMELRLNWIAGAHSLASLFVAVSDNELSIIGNPSSGGAFWAERGAIRTEDLDGDGILEIIEPTSSMSDPDRAPRVYRKKDGRFEYQLSTPHTVDR